MEERGDGVSDAMRRAIEKTAGVSASPEAIRRTDGGVDPVQAKSEQSLLPALDPFGASDAAVKRMEDAARLQEWLEKPFAQADAFRASQELDAALTERYASLGMEPKAIAAAREFAEASDRLVKDMERNREVIDRISARTSEYAKVGAALTKDIEDRFRIGAALEAVTSPGAVISSFKPVPNPWADMELPPLPEIPDFEDVEMAQLSVATMRAMTDEELLCFIAGESDIPGAISVAMSQRVTTELLRRSVERGQKPHWTVAPGFWVAVAAAIAGAFFGAFGPLQGTQSAAPTPAAPPVYGVPVQTPAPAAPGTSGHSKACPWIAWPAC